MTLIEKAGLILLIVGVGGLTATGSKLGLCWVIVGTLLFLIGGKHHH